MAAVICKDMICTYIVYLVAVYGCHYLQRYYLYLHCVSCCGKMAAVICKDMSCTYIAYLVAVKWLPLFAKI